MIEHEVSHLPPLASRLLRHVDVCALATALVAVSLAWQRCQHPPRLKKSKKSLRESLSGLPADPPAHPPPEESK